MRIDALLRPFHARVDVGLVYHYDLSGPLPDFSARIPIEMRRADRSDVEAAAALADTSLREKFLGRLDEGMACFVATKGGSVVAYNWARFRSGEDEGDTIVLRPGEIYTTDAFTAPEYRGHGIHTATLAYIMGWAKAEGYRDAYTLVSARRRVSWKTHQRLGWTRTGILLRVRVRDLVRVRARSPFVVIACAGSPRPVATRRAAPA